MHKILRWEFEKNIPEKSMTTCFHTCKKTHILIWLQTYFFHDPLAPLILLEDCASRWMVSILAHLCYCNLCICFLLLLHLEKMKAKIHQRIFITYQTDLSATDNLQEWVPSWTCGHPVQSSLLSTLQSLFFGLLQGNIGSQIS